MANNIHNRDLIRHLQPVLDLAVEHPELPLTEWAATYLIRQGPRRRDLVVIDPHHPEQVVHTLGVRWLDAIRTAIGSELVGQDEVANIVQQVIYSAKVETFGLAVAHALDGPA